MVMVYTHIIAVLCWRSLRSGTEEQPARLVNEQRASCTHNIKWGGVSFEKILTLSYDISGDGAGSLLGTLDRGRVPALWRKGGQRKSRQNVHGCCETQKGPSGRLAARNSRRKTKDTIQKEIGKQPIFPPNPFYLSLRILPLLYFLFYIYLMLTVAHFFSFLSCSYLPWVFSLFVRGT